jgi:hypothetical protein
MLPDASTAASGHSPQVSDRLQSRHILSAVAGLPLPATVVMIPEVSTFRILCARVGDVHVPAGSTATALGLVNLAAVAGPHPR